MTAPVAGSPAMTTIELARHYRPFLFGYLPAFIGAEVLIAHVDPRLGLALHAVLLLALIWQGARSPGAGRDLYWALALAPLLRVLSLTVPTARLTRLQWYAALSVPLLLSVGAAARAMEYRAPDLGLRWRWGQLPAHVLVGLIGLPLGLLGYLVLNPGPAGNGGAPTGPGLWLPALIVLLLAGFTEELIFRGLMQRAVGRVFGSLVGPLIVVVVSSALYLGASSVAELGLVVLAHSLFAVIAAGSGSVWGVGLAHGLMNVTYMLGAPLLAPRVLG